MSDRSRRDECEPVMALIDDERDGLDIGESGRARLRAHLDACSGCSRWKTETDDLIAVASALPQFDPPESLTQSIVMAVAADQQGRNRSYDLLFMCCAILLSAIFMLGEAAESIPGFMSWLVCLVFMFALEAFFSSGRRQGMLVKK